MWKELKCLFDFFGTWLFLILVCFGLLLLFAAYEHFVTGTWFDTVVWPWLIPVLLIWYFGTVLFLK